jgi:hypothetical protein
MTPTTRFWQTAFEDPLADRAGTVFQIDGVPSYANSYLVDRILKLTSAKGHSARYSTDHIYLKIVPPIDSRSVAPRIDFATVQRIEGNTVFLRIDPKRLPAALPPAITVSSNPNFYRQNLADLTSWDARRQLEAAERLSKANGKGPRAEIRVALESFYKSSGDTLARRYAVEGLGVWGDAASLPTLETAMRDSNVMVRRSATFAAAKAGRSQAAEIVARQLVDDYRTASDALRLIGPDAEQAVWPYLKHENTFTRQAAAKVLQDIGTGDSLRPLIEAETSSDHVLSDAARQARESIERRKGAP